MQKRGGIGVLGPPQLQYLLFPWPPNVLFSGLNREVHSGNMGEALSHAAEGMGGRRPGFVSQLLASQPVTLNMSLTSPSHSFGK